MASPITKDDEEEDEEDVFACFGSSDDEQDDDNDEHDEEQDETAAIDAKIALARGLHLAQTANCTNNATNSKADVVPIHPIPGCGNYEIYQTASTTSNSNNTKSSIPTPTPPTRPHPTPTPIDEGMGMRACRAYVCGEEILREIAVMRIPRYAWASSAEEAAARHTAQVQRRFQQLHPLTQTHVMELSSAGAGGGKNQKQHNEFGFDEFFLEDDDDGDGNGNMDSTSRSSQMHSVLQQQQQQSHKVMTVCETNCFQLENERDQGLFLTLCRLNHSCRPNANHFWRQDLQMILVFATRDIEEGEDIYTSYGPSQCLDTAGRRAFLKERFSFDCMCDMCRDDYGNLTTTFDADADTDTNNNNNNNGGDANMLEIGNLQERIGLLTSCGQYDAAMEAIDACLLKLEAQGIGTGTFTKPILHFGFQVSLIMARHANDGGGDTGSGDDGEKGNKQQQHHEAIAKSYLTRELTAVQQSEGIDSPKALKIQILLKRLLVGVLK